MALTILPGVIHSNSTKGGPAGAILASRLASTASKPSVLLLEAGGPQPSKEDLSLANRWTLFQSKPSLNWGYKSTKQPRLAGREVDVSRGKALGGTTNINFSCWTPPSRDSVDEWQERVGGDPLFGWESTQRLLDGIVKYGIRDLEAEAGHPLHGSTDRLVTEFVAEPTRQGTGPFEVEWSRHLKKGDVATLDAVKEHGFTMNLDLISGNSLGFGIMPASSTGGISRHTAATAFLADAPANLTIKTGLEVTRVLFEGKTAKAVEVNGGADVFEAKRCVVLSAGAINTPKILMLSGVGPADHLATNNIPLVSNNGAVGQHLKDHLAIFLSWKTREDLAGPVVVPSTVPTPSHDMLNTAVGFERDETMMRHPNFSKLPAEEQRLLMRKGTATLEMALPVWRPHQGDMAPKLYIGLFHLLPQSSGSVTLASSDWEDAPEIDLNVFGDEGGLDLASAKAYVHRGINFVEKTESLSRHIIEPFQRPKSDSDDDISEYIRQATGTVWHPSCTTRMGPANDTNDNSVVDPSFKVRGLESLRVADLGVTPFIPNCHPVTVALLIGAQAAEKMIAEYDL